MSENPQKSTALKSVLIAVREVPIVRDITAILKDDHGVTAPTVVPDGEAAWNALNAGAFDCIIMDWDLMKIPSVTLFNKIRLDKRYHRVPVMVISKSSQKERIGIIKDYLPSGVAEGDFSALAFGLKFGTLLKESLFYRDDHPFLGTFADHWRRDAAQAQTDLKALQKTVPNSVALLNVAASRLFDAGLFEDAESLVGDALALSGQNATAVMLKSKILQITGRHFLGIELMALHKFSAKDVGRSLIAGELNLAVSKLEGAHKLFSKALEIDPTCERAKLGLRLSSNLKAFLSREKNPPVDRAFNALLAAVGTALAEAGTFDLAVEHFNAAFEFTYDAVERAELMCELGLCYMKIQKNPEAIDWLKKAQATSGGKVHRAAKALKTLLPNAA